MPVPLRSKRMTREVMERAGLPTPRYAHIDSEKELDAAIEHVGFPAIMKPAMGAAAKFVRQVSSKKEALETFAAIKKGVAKPPKVEAIISDGAL